MGETLAVGAARETFEEAWAKGDDLRPYVLLNLPFINQRESSCTLASVKKCIRQG